MRDREGDQGWLWLAFISANSVGWAVNIVASFVWMASASRGFSAGGPLAELQADLINYGYIFTEFGSVMLVPTASVVMARTGMVSRRLGQLGFAVTAIQLLYLVTAFFSTGPLAGGGVVTIAGFTILGLWFLAVSVGMVSVGMVLTAPKGRPATAR